MKNNEPVENGNVYRGSTTNNNNKNKNKNNENTDADTILDFDTYIIDNLDQKLLELLEKGYENKKIALEVKTPLSTIQRRIRKIFEKQYITKKNELNYSKLGLRKGFVQITLKGGNSHMVAQKIAGIRGIVSVSEVTGNNYDILCVCVFRDTESLFNIMEKIKTIERIDNVAWAEEVHSLELQEGGEDGKAAKSFDLSL